MYSSERCRLNWCVMYCRQFYWAASPEKIDREGFKIWLLVLPEYMNFASVWLPKLIFSFFNVGVVGKITWKQIHRPQKKQQLFYTRQEGMVPTCFRTIFGVGHARWKCTFHLWDKMVGSLSNGPWSLFLAQITLARPCDCHCTDVRAHSGLQWGCQRCVVCPIRQWQICWEHIQEKRCQGGRFYGTRSMIFAWKELSFNTVYRKVFCIIYRNARTAKRSWDYLD